MANGKTARRLLSPLALILLATLVILFGPLPSGAENQDTPLAFSGDAHGKVNYWDNNLDSDTDYSASLRLQLEIRPLADLSFSARLNTGKTFNPDLVDDDYFMLDRFYLEWRKIMGLPIQARGGRLPTMGNNGPTHLRMGLDQPEGDFSPFADLALDGISMGIARPEGGWLSEAILYAAGQEDAGYESAENPFGLEDTEIYGLGLTVYRDTDASATLLGLAFRNIYNVPEDVTFINPLEYAMFTQDPNYYDPLNPATNLILDRNNLGNIYQLTAQWQARTGSLHYFLSGAWSRTDARGMDELGTSLLGSWWEQPDNKNGYAVYAGARYDFGDLPLELGLEYNYGSKYWIAFGANNKLNTRGSVGEIYTIYTLPRAKIIDRSLLRLGCRYFDFEYTGSGFWLGTPQKIDDLTNDPLAIQFYTPPTHELNVYTALDLYF